MPFAVVGSNTVLEVANKKVRGRQYPWGVAEGKYPLLGGGGRKRRNNSYVHSLLNLAKLAVFFLKSCQSLPDHSSIQRAILLTDISPTII